MCIIILFIVEISSHTLNEPLYNYNNNQFPSKPQETSKQETRKKKVQRDSNTHHPYSSSQKIFLILKGRELSKEQSKP